MTKQNTKNFHINKITQLFASSYDSAESLMHYGDATLNIGLLQAERAIISQCFKNLKDLKVADIGCGTGRFILNWALEHPNSQIDGFDISSNSIDLIYQFLKMDKFKQVYDRVKLYCCDITKYNFTEEQKYDLIFFSFNTLMCIPGHDNKIKALQKAFAQLKPQGWLIFTADEANNNSQKQAYIAENAKKLSQDNPYNFRNEDIVYSMGKGQGILCFYNKDDIFKLVQEANLPQPTYAITRDVLAPNESEEALRFSDNAYYYAIEKR